MEYKMTQAELCEAVQLYLNEQVLKRPVTIVEVRPITTGTRKPNQPALEITCFDDQAQLSTATPPGDE